MQLNGYQKVLWNLRIQVSNEVDGSELQLAYSSTLFWQYKHVQGK